MAVTEACRFKAHFLSSETLKANANELTFLQTNHVANLLLCLSSRGCVWLRPQEALVLLYDPSPLHIYAAFGKEEENLHVWTFFPPSETTAELYVAISFLSWTLGHCVGIFLSRLLCVCRPDCESCGHTGKCNHGLVPAKGTSLR